MYYTTRYESIRTFITENLHEYIMKLFEICILTRHCHRHYNSKISNQSEDVYRNYKITFIANTRLAIYD